MRQFLLRAGVLVSVAVVNWWAGTGRASAVPCWGGGARCDSCYVDPAPLCTGLSCPEPFWVTCCKHGGSPAWTSCDVNGDGSCSLGEFCTC